eukprot:TRINITY_DN7513_c3_g1_i2.p1 TRINITY_DN7513_c3_g1~~TRINITY_DN7513_c3_g1_i2.p1  ORF type:complete len:252 (+),score=49.61 TRINITY_DN7513_c3_g1_i2:44-799(+)
MPPIKRLKKSNSFRSDETDRVLNQHKESLQAQMQTFMDSLPPLTTRYYDFLNNVKKLNPNTVAPEDGKEQRSPGKVRAVRRSHSQTSNMPPRGEIKEAKDLPPLPNNDILLNQLSILKKEATELGKSLTAIGEWIALMVPTIKDEDNHGVEVQQLVHSEISGFCKEVEGKYELESDYVESRASMESKYYKHFLAPSWFKVIEKHDSNRWDDVELAWKELVRIVLSTYTILTNNMEKLRNPRGGSGASYMTM